MAASVPNWPSAEIRAGLQFASISVEIGRRLVHAPNLLMGIAAKFPLKTRRKPLFFSF